MDSPERKFFMHNVFEVSQRRWQPGDDTLDAYLWPELEKWRRKKLSKVNVDKKEIN